MFTIASQLPSDCGVESLFVESVCFPLERLNTQLLATLPSKTVELRCTDEIKFVHKK